jgi:hypothetical protein
MYQVNDKVGGIKIIQPIVTGDADYDLNNLTIQYGNGMSAFWDLNASVTPIINQLPKYALKSLKDKGKCIWRDWDLFYIPSKIFSVCYKGGKNFLFYNLSQYFPEVANPGDDIAERCAEELEHALHIMGIWPNKLSSPAAIFQDYYGKHLSLPTYKDFMPDYTRMLEYASECAGNEWNEVFKIGHFKSCYSYDRKSAYANEMINLLDNRPKYMRIVESAEYHEDADYGYCDCDIEIYDKTLIHPIFNIAHDGVISAKTGEWRGKLTKGQMDFIRRWDIGDYEINNGWWLTARTEVKPLEQIVPRILKFKEHPNELVNYLAKTMLNGFAGKFNEEYKERVGDLYNPMWSAEIITRNAMNICAEIYKNKCWDKLIQVKVDEFKLTDQLDAIPDGYKESSGDCLAIDNNNVFYRNQHPDNITYNQAIDLLNIHPNMGYYKQGDAVMDIFRLSVSRDFGKLPESGGDILNDIYNSIPISLDSDKFIEDTES